MSRLFAQDDQNTGTSASAPVLPMIIQGSFPLRLTGLISLQSKGLSEVFSSNTVQRHKFFGILHSLQSSSTTIHNHWEDHSLKYKDLCRQCLSFSTLPRFVKAFLTKSNRLLISWLQSSSTAILGP